MLDLLNLGRTNVESHERGILNPMDIVSFGIAAVFTIPSGDSRATVALLVLTMFNTAWVQHQYVRNNSALITTKIFVGQRIFLTLCLKLVLFALWINLLLIGWIFDM